MQLGHLSESGTNQCLQRSFSPGINQVGVMCVAVHHDMCPQLMQIGKVAFIRIEHPEAVVCLRIDLYQIATANGFGQMGTN